MHSQVKKIDDEHRTLSEEATDFAIIIDGWKSRNGNCSILAVTGHVFSGGFSSRRNIVLDCVCFKEESIHCCAHVVNLIVSKTVATSVLGKLLQRIKQVSKINKSSRTKFVHRENGPANENAVHRLPDSLGIYLPHAL